MEVNVRIEPSAKPIICIMQIVGEMKIESPQALYQIVRNNMREDRKLVVNLLDVSDINSGGIAELTLLHIVFGKDAIALCASQKVLDLLNTVDLLSVFSLFDSEEAAIRSFRP